MAAEFVAGRVYTYGGCAELYGIQQFDKVICESTFALPTKEQQRYATLVTVDSRYLDLRQERAVWFMEI